MRAVVVLVNKTAVLFIQQPSSQTQGVARVHFVHPIIGTRTGVMVEFCSIVVVRRRRERRRRPVGRDGRRRACWWQRFVGRRGRRCLGCRRDGEEQQPHAGLVCAMAIASVETLRCHALFVEPIPGLPALGCPSCPSLGQASRGADLTASAMAARFLAAECCVRGLSVALSLGSGVLHFCFHLASALQAASCAPRLILRRP